MMTNKGKAVLRVGVLCFGGLVCAQSANAVVYGYEVLTQKTETERTTVPVQRVSEYPRPEYEAEPKKVGSFDVLLGADAQVTYSDNIYATDTNEESDVITSILPTIAVESDWGQHSLEALLYANMVGYADNDDENSTDFGGNVSGRFDVRRNSYAIGSVSYDALHEDRGAPNAVAASVEPTEYEDTRVQVGYVHTPGRLSFGVLLDYLNKDFENGQTSAGAVVNNNVRDRDEATYTAQVGYEVEPGYTAFVRGELKDVSYDVAGTAQRDSDETSVVVGTALDLGGKTSGQVYAGYMKRDFDSAQYNNISSLTYGADVLWNINRLTSVEVAAKRSIEETTAVNASAYVNTGVSVAVEHELKRNILLGGSFAIADHQYKGISREDDYVGLGLEARYLINKTFSIGIGYDYSNRDSNVAGNDYTNNQIMLKLTGNF